MDGPNIYEKKKLRFEKIQKLRRVNDPNTLSEICSSTSVKREREDLTPIGGISSNISANMTASNKKSIDGSSYNGTSS